MSVKCVIYFASIVDQMQTFFIACSSIFGMLSFVLIMVFSMDVSKRFFIKTSVFLFIISLLSGFSAAMLPKSNDVYKLAGVTEQEQGKINALGIVIQTKEGK